MKPEEFYLSYVVICVLNVYLSYIAIILNIILIYAIRRTSSLPKTLKTLLLSLAVSDLGVGLLVQPSYVALRIMAESVRQNTTDNNPAYNTTYIVCLFSLNLFIYASFFCVMALSADRFLAIHFYLSYKDIVTPKRVAASVISFWVFSAFVALIRFWVPNNIMYVIFAIIEVTCVVIGAFFSVKIYLAARGHINRIQALNVQQVAQNREMANVVRMRKFATTAIYVYIVFLVCYLPNICIYFGTMTLAPSTGLKILARFAITLVFLNSSLNPLIYCWKMKHIRRTIIEMLRKMLPAHN